MRRKLVLWGTNEKDEKILVALELLEKDNVVNIYTFPEAVATESFYKEISEQWKDDKEIEFPEGFTKLEQKLSVADSLLPDEIRVERPDLITRAQAEWQFVVLSSKLYGLYKSEVEEFKEKVDALTYYDNKIWEELKTFWGKVQNQVNDKNLFREHGASLRERANSLFDKMKEMKKSLESEYEIKSKEYKESIKTELAEIEEKIEKGLGLNPLFEDLKKVQTKIKDLRFTKDDRNEIWNKIDATFKVLKEKRSGGGTFAAQNTNNVGRIESRYNGLLAAIQKMERSVQMDQKDLDFQLKRIEDSDGQLEAQLRQAKIRMIEERVNSKKEKLTDMLKTKAELEQKIEKEKKRQVKQEKIEKVEEAKEVVKQKIAEGIHETQVEMDKISDKLEKAAAEISAQKGPKKKLSLVQKVTESAENLLEDIVDTVKAVAVVAEDKIEDFVDSLEDKKAKSEEE